MERSVATGDDGESADKVGGVGEVAGVDGVGGLGGGEGSVLGEFLGVAMPAIVTMTSYTVMQFVDKLIVSKLGPEELTGVGNGGIAAFVPAAMLIGGLGVVNTYVSQNLGAGDVRRGARYAWNGLWITVVVWAAVLLPFAAGLEGVFAGMRGALGLESPPAKAVEVELLYGRVLLAGMVFVLMARAIGHYFYGIHKPAVVMVSAVAGNLTNIVLCYGLVFGAWGLPELGVLGAALSTVVGGFIEFVIPFGLFISRKVAAEYATREAVGWSWRHVKDIARIGWPGGAMSGNEIVCWWIFMTGFVASFDTAETGAINGAAGWAVLQYMHLSFMPAVGISIAMTAIVGKYVGMGRLDLARKRTWQGMGLTAGYMGVCGLCFVVFREPMMLLFAGEAGGGGFTEEQRAAMIALGAKLLILAAAFQLFDAVAISLMGALRGAGDTVYAGVVTIALSWLVIVGGGKFLIESAPEWGSVGPWVAAAGYIIALAIALFARFVSGAWERFAVAGPRREGPGEAMGRYEGQSEGVAPGG